MDLGLQGKKALVTGGSKGIGKEIARALVGEGARVEICARTQADLDATLAELGGGITGSLVDVGDKDALEAWVSASSEAMGGLDIVIANVSALAIGQDEESWTAEFNVDLMHTVRLVNAAMPHLEQSATAAIVAISSVSGREIDFAAGPYGTFKAALIHYVQGLAFQLAEQNIRCNTVSPGNIYFEGGVWNWIKDNNKELYDRALALNPTGRMGKPDEVARATVFLASPAASFITGANLVVDGALTRGVQF